MSRLSVTLQVTLRQFNSKLNYQKRYCMLHYLLLKIKIKRKVRVGIGGVDPVDF